ncbi:putative aminopeptidase W07G4.4 [Ptychodera flava]|uniref:putative aminopeptidase W07G4.4 n=1 Tax=Ptychodera flava TaxID=63121 RepID=UPI00396A202D
MAAKRVEDYVIDLFKDSTVKINVISDEAVLEKEYPLHAAVNRCARHIDRHKGRIIELEYVGDGKIDKTLLLVGKGVTYDTGGADVKVGGAMQGMHRDKCGAAGVAGFFQILSVLKPKNIKVLGVMTMVRNSVGPDSYVADEIITSRAGVRVRIGNTDAEGRMAMGDPLCKMKVQALKEINPHIYTIATLTGHAIRAMGPSYSIVLDNGPARRTDHARQLQQAGDLVADPFEISTIRREDYEFHAGKSEYEDVIQAGGKPSTMTDRGHQNPAAFLIRVSGLDKYGIDSATPLAYSHLDIAGSSGPFPGTPTGAPIVALAAYHLLSRI